VAAARRRLAALHDPDAPIELATVHGSKGREWPLVVVLGLEVERFPNQRSLDDAMDPARALEEERRLAYVAVTRARRRLVLAFDPKRPSPFVGELLGRSRATTYRPTSSATTVR
jgi:superfamily I DNA/RNA helicase